MLSCVVTVISDGRGRVPDVGGVAVVVRQNHPAVAYTWNIRLSNEERALSLGAVGTRRR